MSPSAQSKTFDAGYFSGAHDTLEELTDAKDELAFVIESQEREVVILSSKFAGLLVRKTDAENTLVSSKSALDSLIKSLHDLRSSSTCSKANAVPMYRQLQSLYNVVLDGRDQLVNLISDQSKALLSVTSELHATYTSRNEIQELVENNKSTLAAYEHSITEKEEAIQRLKKAANDINASLGEMLAQVSCCYQGTLPKY